METSTQPDPTQSSVDPIETPFDLARDRLIVALDVRTADAALDLADHLQSQCQWFKVGLELFIAAGPSVVEKLVARGHSVFLDLKLHDIPNTVAGAVRTAAALGAQLLTIHAAGGPAMLAAAREASAELTNPPQLLAVTMLTSVNASQAAAIGLPRSPEDQVTLLAKMGIDAGMNGFVCSAQEVATLRALTGPRGVLVTPGIRPSGADAGDQQRIATPTYALQQGSSYIVVGRPITQAPDPALAAEAILLEIAEALAIAPRNEIKTQGLWRKDRFKMEVAPKHLGLRVLEKSGIKCNGLDQNRSGDDLNGFIGMTEIVPYYKARAF